MPDVAESWTPTCGDPETTGGAVTVSTPGATAGVATEVLLAEVASASEAVTLTRICWPSWAAPGVNVRLVAPLTATPPAYHW